MANGVVNPGPGGLKTCEVHVHAYPNPDRTERARTMVWLCPMEGAFSLSLCHSRTSACALWEIKKTKRINYIGEFREKQISYFKRTYSVPGSL